MHGTAKDIKMKTATIEILNEGETIFGSRTAGQYFAGITMSPSLIHLFTVALVRLRIFANSLVFKPVLSTTILSDICVNYSYLYKKSIHSFRFLVYYKKQ